LDNKDLDELFLPYDSIQSGVARATAVVRATAVPRLGCLRPGIGFIGGTHRLDTKDVFEVAPARASHLPENGRESYGYEDVRVAAGLRESATLRRHSEELCRQSEKLFHIFWITELCLL